MSLVSFLYRPNDVLETEYIFFPYFSITVRLLLIGFRSSSGKCRWMNGGKVDCPELKFEDENGNYDPSRE